jgi:hypothetical protein
MAKTYAEKLLDPKWQKKRLKVMERDDFACCLCKDKDATLNVHHSYYLKGNEPWDYPDESLVTVCAPCHKKVEKLKKRLEGEVAKSASAFFLFQRFFGGAFDSPLWHDLTSWHDSLRRVESEEATLGDLITLENASLHVVRSVMRELEKVSTKASSLQ